MKRLGYTKSRNGCARCKERRVKCDERRPCKACLRHSLPCSLESLPAHEVKPHSLKAHSKPETSQRSPAVPSPPQEQSPKHVCQPASPQSLPYPVYIGVDSPSGRAQSSSPPPVDPFFYFARLFATFKPESPSGWNADIELMHHYTAVTYSTISFSPQVARALQHDLPMEAHRYPFLLHQILALSGFHIAFLRPHCRHTYLMQASQHQNSSINGMREALSEAITPSNCHVVYATSIFIILCSFAIYPSSEKYNSFFSAVDSLPDIFTLIKGMGLILQTFVESIRTSPLKGLFHKPPSHPLTVTLIQPLGSRLPELIVHIEDDILLSQDTKACLKDAVCALSNCLTKVCLDNNETASAELRAVCLWPLMMPTEFIDLIRQRNPAALAILGHYSIVLYAAESTCWFLQGWGEALATSITESLADTPWSPLLGWVNDFMGSMMAQDQESHTHVGAF